ncbi:MAG TPA: adenylate/guanylate cyclase domain-containing protein [Microlunatus sp.]|nr:adenylate/guanylate cyclase domain-containing protein [Microlunatus sp.]
MGSSSTDAPDLAPFVPQLLRTWLTEDTTAAHRIVGGTLAMIDISGFTQLTERLAAHGKVGAEELTEMLDTIFSELLQLARHDGAQLVKWAGDAVVLLFEGDHHAVRAARAAHRMRTRLRRVGTVRKPVGPIGLRMSVGIHSGELALFLVGDPTIHRELIVCGPTATRTAQIGSAARTDEIRLSPETAELLPGACVDLDGALPLLTQAPEPHEAAPTVDPLTTADADLEAVLSPPIREYLLAGEWSAEHRKVAVGFVRLSGTDDLLARSGTEHLVAALEECVQLVQHAAQRHGVTFLESDIDTNGVRVMIVAGAPRSGDHDVDRLLRTVQQILGTSTALPTQIGVARGAVFAGVLGPSFTRTYSVKGDAVNVAARLAARARPGEALVALTSLTPASERFEYERLPPMLVKGKSAPVEVIRLGSSTLQRLESPAADGELTGRNEEMAALRSAVESAAGGNGQLVEVSGEAGVGKSRLVQALLAEADLPSYLIRCDEYETLTPYWPFRDLFISALRLPAGHRDAAALGDAVAERVPALMPWLPLMAKILDVDVASTAEVDAVDDRFRQAKLQEIAAQCLAAVLPDRMLLVFEDVHLMDDASAGLLDRLCAEAADRSWIILVTKRDVPEGFVPNRAAVSIRLGPLDDDAATRLAKKMAANEQMPRSVLDTVARRAGGNPLFLRRLLQASTAGGSVDELPDTVEGLITSQLDSLPAPERTALRYASVLGMRFERSALRTLLGGRDLPTTTDSMQRMAAFIRPYGDSYGFVHQLVRDTAYETLPFRTRRTLHGTAGDLLEAEAAEPDEIAEVLSLHFGQADRPDKAWHYARIGGERAARKYAYIQAEELFARAVRAARQVAHIPNDDLVATNIALGDARFRIGRPHEAIKPYRAARHALLDNPVEAALLLRREAEIEYRMGRFSVALGKLTRGLNMLSENDEGHQSARARIEAFYAITRQAQGRFRDAHRWARRAEADARSSGDLAAQAEALQAAFSALAMLGDTSHSASAREAISAYEELGDRAGQSRALNNLAMLAWLDGRGVEALAMFGQAQLLATDAGDAVKAAAAEYNVGDVLLRIGRLEEARQLFSELVPVLRSVGLEDYAVTATRALGTAMALTGQPDEGADLIHRARTRLVELGEQAEVLETDAALAWTALEAGNAEQAAALATDAAQRAESLDIVHLLPWLLRLRGAALADLGQQADAFETLQRARRLADMHSRVELGFVLAELSRVCRWLGTPQQAAEFAGAAETAFTQLGFVGTRRYPRGSGAHEPRILREQDGQSQRS